MRSDITFTSGGVRCEAWLYRPEGAADDARLPIIVMGHGLGATRTMRLDAFAERFVDAGYACLAFDYRHFGGSDGEPRQLLNVKRQLEDWAAAIDHARSLPGIDPERVVIWGTSFGGGHVVATAARDHRLAAAIAQCPFTDGIASATAFDRTAGLVKSLGAFAEVSVTAVRDLIRGLRGAEPLTLPGAGEPGTASFMPAPDALPGMNALRENAPDAENALTARSVLEVLRYRPGRRAKDVACPIFVALCQKDTVAPHETARKQLSRAPLAEVHEYPIGHFDIYLGEAFEVAVADYIDFLARHVPVG